MSFHRNTAKMEGFQVLNNIAAQKWWVIPTSQLEADAFTNSLTCGLGISFDKFVAMFSSLGLIRTKKSVVHVQRDRWEQFEGGMFRVNFRYCFCNFSRKEKRFTFISRGKPLTDKAVPILNPGSASTWSSDPINASVGNRRHNKRPWLECKVDGNEENNNNNKVNTCIRLYACLEDVSGLPWV